MAEHSRSLPDFTNTEIAFAWQSTPKLYESYMLFKALGSSSLVKLGTGAISTALRLHLPVTPLIRHTIFRQFCGGTSLEDCLATISRMYKFGVKSILDYSVEACSSEDELDEVAEEIKRTIMFAQKHDGVAMSVFKVTGIIRSDLLDKVATKAKLSESDTADFARGKARVSMLCEEAEARGVPLLIDAEESWIQEPIDCIAEDMMRTHNTQRPIIYNTLQMYRWDRLDYLKNALNRSKNAGFKYGAKLVRGAYMEKERERAKRLNYKSPIQVDKAATDADFNAALKLCVDHHDDVGLFAGTHNEASTLLLVKLMQEKGLAAGHRDITFSQLYGMSDNLSYNLAKHGYNVAKYLPYGPVKSVLPYLFRRAAENTSIAGQAGRELTLISEELARRAK